MHSVGAGRHGQRSRFGGGEIHQQLGTAVVDFLGHLPGERLEIGRTEILLPQLDEMYAPCCPVLHQIEKPAAKCCFGLSRRRGACDPLWHKAAWVESILHFSEGPEYARQKTSYLLSGLSLNSQKWEINIFDSFFRYPSNKA